MWFYLRLLDSELRGCITHNFDKPKSHYGASYSDFEDKDRYFRSKRNFMKKVQVQGMKLYLAILPFFFHKFIYKDTPEISGVVVTDKTKAIFGSAEALGLLKFPVKISNDINYPLLFVESEPYKPTEDKNEIAISYEKGNRFVSWSGLVSFLYKHHWQFALILWTIVITTTAKIFGFFSLICAQYSKIPMCL